MDLKLFIVTSKFFARARTRIYRSATLLAFCIVFISLFSQLHAEPFILNLDHQAEVATRNSMGISNTCGAIKKNPTAVALMGSEGARVDPRIHSSRGLIVLEGLRGNSEPKRLHTALLSAYKNYPTSIPGEMGMQPSPRFSLAVTIAATLTGTGGLHIQTGDYVIVHADGQLYAYSLPHLIIPSEGLLRLYLGTDDQLYFDAALAHPIHAGACGDKQQ